MGCHVHPSMVAQPYSDNFFLPKNKRFSEGQTIIGPCGFGCTVVKDSGGPYLLIEDYMGDHIIISRAKLPDQ